METKPVEQLLGSDMGAGVFAGFLAALHCPLERIAQKRVGLLVVALVLTADFFDGLLESSFLHCYF